MKPSLFSPTSDFIVMQKGQFNDLYFRFGQESQKHPDIEFLVVYSKEETSEPQFVVTLSKKEPNNPTQALSFYSQDTFDCQILFTEPTQEDFLHIAHTWTKKCMSAPKKVWDVPLQHYPVVKVSKSSEFGSIQGYRYVFHTHARTEDELLPFLLVCYAPREKRPALVLYVENRVPKEYSVHMFHRNEHKFAVETLTESDPHGSMLSIAEKVFSSSVKEENSEFSVPIFQLNLAEIKHILKLDQLFEHSLLVIVLAIVGHILYSLISIPFVGWFFLLISGFCWLIATIHGMYSFSALFSNMAFRIPACTLFLIPFFFPQYGPTLLLLIFIFIPIFLRRAIRTKGIRISGNGIQDDEKVLLTTRKMHLEQEAKDR
jgi:hypothetical protein